jgi:hypothetical protein
LPEEVEMTRLGAPSLSGLLLTALLAAGCSTEVKDEILMQTALPGVPTSASLSLVKERGDYLDVVMESGMRQYRFFLPDEEACRALLVGGQAVTYVNVGPFGQLRTEDAACNPVGILSLTQWRNRRPRREISSMIPRSRAELREVVYADDDLTLVRGRFLLASDIGFVGGQDVIAVIPQVEECQGLGKTASMEFRHAGKQPYTLINGRQICPILGFVQVPPNP